MAGEIRHVRLTADGPIGFHKAGSAEGWVSGGGLARWVTTAVPSAILREIPQDQQITASDVGLADEKGDTRARRIVTKCGEKLGMAEWRWRSWSTLSTRSAS
jgi:glucokinase